MMTNITATERTLNMMRKGQLLIPVKQLAKYNSVLLGAYYMAKRNDSLRRIPVGITYVVQLPWPDELEALLPDIRVLFESIEFSNDVNFPDYSWKPSIRSDSESEDQETPASAVNFISWYGNEWQGGFTCWTDDVWIGGKGYIHRYF